MGTIINRCELLMKRRGISQKELSVMIGKPYRTVNSWFNSRKMTPKTADTVKIAQALHTTVEYLVTGKEPDIPFISDKVKKILDATRSMSDDDIDRLVTIAESLATLSRGESVRGAG